MAKQGERVAGSNRDRVRDFLRANPGHHRPTEIAAATGLSPHQVAIAARGMAVDHGEAVRGERPATNGGRPFKTYAAADVSAASQDGQQ